MSAPRTYHVLVRYRTRSGCNARTLAVPAASLCEAIKIAMDKVARSRGVVRVDSGQAHDYWPDHPKEF